MKKRTPFFTLILSLVFAVILSFSSCIINNTKPEDCSIVTATITEITEGSSYDIVFHDDGTDFYYINRGIELGLNLDSLNAKVLNKSVTLHVPKLVYGNSRHITQMAIGDEIIYTEFPSGATED